MFSGLIKHHFPIGNQEKLRSLLRIPPKEMIFEGFKDSIVKFILSFVEDTCFGYDSCGSLAKEEHKWSPPSM